MPTILSRDQNSVSASGVLSSEEVATFDVPEIVNGILTVTTREAPDTDRTYVENGRLTVITGVSTPDWVPEGSYFDWEVLNNRAWNGSGILTKSEAATYTGGPSLVLDTDDTYDAFAANALPVNGLGLQLEVASTRLTQYPKTLSFWNNIGGVTVTGLGTVLGVFDGAVSVASNGATWNQIQLQTTSGTLTSGVGYRFFAILKAGTSPTSRLELIRVDGTLSCTIDGLPGAMTVTSENGATVTGLAQTELDDGWWLIEATYTPAANSEFRIGIIPFSATSGHTILAAAAGIMTGPGSPIIEDEDDYAEVRAASALAPALGSGTHDLELTFDDASTQVIADFAGGGSTVVDPSVLDRPRVTILDWRDV